MHNQAKDAWHPGRHAAAATTLTGRNRLVRRHSSRHLDVACSCRGGSAEYAETSKAAARPRQHTPRHPQSGNGCLLGSRAVCACSSRRYARRDCGPGRRGGHRDDGRQHGEAGIATQPCSSRRRSRQSGREMGNVSLSRCRSQHHGTLLIAAAEAKHEGLIRALVERGAKLTASDRVRDSGLDALRSWHRQRGELPRLRRTPGRRSCGDFWALWRRVHSRAAQLRRTAQVSCKPQRPILAPPAAGGGGLCGDLSGSLGARRWQYTATGWSRPGRAGRIRDAGMLPAGAVPGLRGPCARGGRHCCQSSAVLSLPSSLPQFGDTCLHEVCRGGLTDVARWLVERGASIGAPSSVRRWPLPSLHSSSHSMPRCCAPFSRYRSACPRHDGVRRGYGLLAPPWHPRCRTQLR